ncbi:MAG TPA: DNRLRE domain-containing protein [Tepidisphaeraceae bacterium]|nr:DNRLRE domain-containing protein [Tepidisphaeraceae bacterium]
MNPNDTRTAVQAFEQLESRTLLATDLPAVADAYVRDGASASSNFGSASELIVKQSANLGNTREGYLRFSIGATPVVAGQTVKLRLFGKLADTQDDNLPVALLPVADTTWGETAITWNTKPAPTASTPLDSQTISGTTAKWYEWDVTDHVINAKARGAGGVAFALRSTNVSDTQIFFNSEEASSNDPVLSVSDATAPEPPPTETTAILGTNTSTYVRNGTYASQNFGGASEILVKRSPNVGNTREGYLKFDLSPITGDVTAAKLRLNGKLSAAGSVAVAVHGASDTTWSETLLTWNNKPAAGAALATKTISGTGSAWYEWDITNYLQQLKNAGATAVTFALKAPNTTDPWAIFASDENPTAVNRPQLVVGQAEPVQGLVLSKTALTANEGAAGRSPFD